MKNHKSPADFHAIVEYRKLHPCVNMNEIGRHFGLCRERIRQILVREGVRTTSTKRDRCVCPSCGGRKQPKSKTCRACTSESFRATGSKFTAVACTGCGELFLMNTSFLVYATSKRGYKHFFHNRACMSHWVGINYGFGTRKSAKSIARIKTTQTEND